VEQNETSKFCKISLEHNTKNNEYFCAIESHNSLAWSI